MNKKDWNVYVKKIRNNLILLYRKEFQDLLFDVLDKELVSFRNTTEVTSYNLHGHVVSTWIDNKEQIIRTCFNHEWCSGYFFLQYGSIIYQGECPNPANFPNMPFIAEYSCLKMLINKPHLPISDCFSTNIPISDIKRIQYQINISKKPKCISSRTYILWNVMKTLNFVHPKIII